MYGAGRSRITHPFATLTQEQAPGIPFDLHVLSTPPAFILSQNRTLHKKTSRRESTCDSQNKENRLRLIRKGAIARKPRRPSRPLGHSPTGSGRRTGNH